MNPELQAIEKCHLSLELSFKQPNSKLMNFFVAEGVISSEIRDFLQDKDAEVRARELVKWIRNRVELDSSSYHILLHELKSKTYGKQYHPVVKSLEKECNEQHQEGAVILSDRSTTNGQEEVEKYSEKEPQVENKFQMILDALWGARKMNIARKIAEECDMPLVGVVMLLEEVSMRKTEELERASTGTPLTVSNTKTKSHCKPIAQLSEEARIDLQFQLELNFKELLDYYDDYTSALQEFLEKKKSVEIISDYLVGLSSLVYDPKLALLSPSMRNKLDRATTISKIFAILKTECASFLDYHIFEQLMRNFKIKREDDERLNYPERLKAYVKKHRISEFIELQPILGELEDKMKLVLVLDIDIMCRLVQILDVEKAVVKIMGLKPSDLLIYDIKEGCVIVTFLISIPLAEFIFTSDDVFTNKQKKEFQKLSVVRLECNGYTYEFGKELATADMETAEVVNCSNATISEKKSAALALENIKTANVDLLDSTSLSLSTKSSGVTNLQLPVPLEEPVEKDAYAGACTSFGGDVLYQEESLDDVFISISNIEKGDREDLDYSEHLRMYVKKHKISEFIGINPRLKKTLTPLPPKDFTTDATANSTNNLILEADSAAAFHTHVASSSPFDPELELPKGADRKHHYVICMARDKIRTADPSPPPNNTTTDFTNDPTPEASPPHVTSSSSSSLAFLDSETEMMGNALALEKVFEVKMLQEWRSNQSLMCKPTEGSQKGYKKFIFQQGHGEQNHYSLLHKACAEGNINLVKTLLREYSNAFNRTPLHRAASLHSAYAKGVETLLHEHKADFNALGKTPLHVAVLRGRLDVVWLLIKDFGSGYKGQSILHSACIEGNINLVEAPLHEDFNALDNTPLHLAASRGRFDVALLLIKDFKDFNSVITTKGYKGRSLLHNACVEGNINLVEALLHEDFNALDDTPLHLAASRCRLDVALLLIKNFNSVITTTGYKGRSLLKTSSAPDLVFSNLTLLKWTDKRVQQLQIKQIKFVDHNIVANLRLT